MMRVNFYNVDHGSCTHIITPNNKHFLVDVGSKANKSIAGYIKSKYLHYNETIDWLIITHPHQDHLDDLNNLFDYGLKPRTLSRPRDAFDVVPSSDNEKHIKTVRKINEMHQEYNSEIPPNSDPTNMSYNGGVEISVFPPPSDLCTKEDLNSYSNVIVMSYLGYKFVLTGDNPSNALKSMYERNTDFRNAIANAAILLAPHHGRDNEFCEEFVTKVNPILTIISDGTIKCSTQEYSAKNYADCSRGCILYDQNRKSLTTRSDGNIAVKVYSATQCNISFGEDTYGN